MSGASNTLDPVGAAQDDINRSKHLIASTLDDLTRHHSWLESYHRDERRRAQRLRREEALHRLELRRQRAAWLLRRFISISYAALRSTAAFLARTTVTFLGAARKFTLAAAAWTAPRAHALAVVLLKSLSAGLSWSRRTALSLSRTGFAAASIGFAWTVRTSERLGVAFRKHLSAGFARLSAKAAILAQPMRKRASVEWLRTRLRSRRLASTVQTGLADNWAWARTTTPVATHSVIGWITAESTTLSQALQNNLTTGVAWARTRTQGLVPAVSLAASDGWSWSCSWAGTQASRFLKTSGSGHRALVVRRCTALVSREPWRARLPVVRGS